MIIICTNGWENTPLLASIWLLPVLGNGLFTIAGMIEVKLHRGYFWRPTKLGWWVAWSDFFGSLLFTVGSFSGYGVSAPVANAFNVLGAVLFTYASFLGCIQWKLNQYGNSFLPQLNLGKLPKQVRNRATQYYQLFFLFVCMLQLACEVTKISASVLREADESGVLKSNIQFGLEQILPIGVPMGMLLWSSATSGTKEVPPYSYVLWWLRFLVLAETAASLLFLPLIFADF